MKKIIFSFIYVFLSFYVLAQIDTAFVPVKYYYPNGKISSEGFLRTGKPDGYWKAYYENGILKAEGNRKNFALDSVWKFYTEEGLISLEISYANGLKNGIRRTYQKEEIIEDFFVDDLREKQTKIFFNDGTLKAVIPYLNGLENGTALEYNHDGVIILINEYKKGFLLYREYINRTDPNGLKQGLWKEFYTNGKVKEEITYLNDKKNGYLKKYDSLGTLLSIEKYINDEPVLYAEELKEYELRRDYYPNGQIRIEGSYYNNKPDGIRREFDSLGNVVKGYIFVDGVLYGEGIIDRLGKKQGQWKEYYENGQLMASGVYKNNLRVGNWLFYHRNGNIEQKGSFSANGLPDGEWNYYYESGNLLKKEFYDKGDQEGEYVEYNEDGEIIVKGSFEDGLENGPWYYAIGDIIETGKYQDGVFVDWWEQKSKQDGQIIFRGKYSDGLPSGRHTWYYPNGNKKMEGSYLSGLKEGDWRIFASDGSLIVNITYKNGIEIKYDNIVIKPEINPYTEE